MKDIDLSSMINLTKEVLEIIKKEYALFLNQEKKDLLNSLDFNKLYKLINSQELPPVYLNNLTYYLNTNIKDNLDYNSSSIYLNYLKDKSILEIYEELIPLFCFILLVGDVNFLKLGLIEQEIRKLSTIYNLKISSVNNYKELEVVDLLKQTILEDLPFNIIFLDSDVEIFNYLAEEKGIEVAKLYYEISKKMKAKFKNFSKNNFNLLDFIKYYENVSYEDILDLIYDFVNQKIK